MHINIRSLQCNLNGVTNLLSNIALNFSFIGISETGFKNLITTCICLAIILSMSIGLNQVMAVLVYMWTKVVSF